MFNYPPLFMLIVAATIWLVFFKLPLLLGRLGIHATIPGLSTTAERIVARSLSAAAGVTSVWLLFCVAARLCRSPGFMASSGPGSTCGFSSVECRSTKPVLEVLRTRP